MKSPNYLQPPSLLPTMNNRDLCLALLTADTEAEVIAILKHAGYWDDLAVWTYFGGTENNYSIIGNQQATAPAALVEKLTNAIDAMLLLQWQRITKQDKDSTHPANPRVAAQQFFHIPNGDLSALTETERRKLSNNISLVATGNKSTPSFSIIDRGEGQHPDRFPETFLSLNRSNKLRIPFVQGKFNMGGTGALVFAGQHNFQLIVSRRPDDLDGGPWGFTITRRFPPDGTRRSSTFMYLAPKGTVMTFAGTNPLIYSPRGRTASIAFKVTHGTIIKLYEYRLQPKSLASNIILDLNYHLSLLLAEPVLPIRLYEQRQDFVGHSLEANLVGLKNRLRNERTPLNNEPLLGSISLSAEEKVYHLPVSIYVFKDKPEHYKDRQGILFVLNGQCHGVISQDFFKRKHVKLSYLEDLLLVVVECDALPNHVIEELFMNSRDRLKDTSVRRQLEQKLEIFLSNHEVLKQLAEQKRLEIISQAAKSDDGIEAAVEKILNNNRDLANILLKGGKLKDPWSSRPVQEQVRPFVGKKYPSFFVLDIGQENGYMNIGRRFLVRFRTDAADDFFFRDEDPGEFKLLRYGEEYYSYDIHANNGIVNCNVQVPDEVQEGDVVQWEAVVSDIARVDPFRLPFRRQAVKHDVRPGGPPSRRRPIAEGDGKAAGHALSAMPSIQKVRRDHWQDVGFDKFSALSVKHAPDGSLDFLINMDNAFLVSEISKNPKNSILLEKQFEGAIVLFGLAICAKFREQSAGEEYEDSARSLDDAVRESSSWFAMVILPIIQAFANLEDLVEENVESTGDDPGGSP